MSNGMPFENLQQLVLSSAQIHLLHEQVAGFYFLLLGRERNIFENIPRDIAYM
jgi:hypothetical protein